MLAVRCAYNPKMHHHTHAKTKQARLGTSSRTSSSKKQHAVVVCNWCTLHVCRTTQEAGVTFEKETEHDWKPRSPTRIKTGSKKNIHSWTLESFDLRMEKEKKDGKEFRGWISWMSVKGRCHSVEFNMPSSDGCTKTGEIVIDLLGFRHPEQARRLGKGSPNPRLALAFHNLDHFHNPLSIFNGLIEAPQFQDGRSAWGTPAATTAARHHRRQWAREGSALKMKLKRCSSWGDFGFEKKTKRVWEWRREKQPCGHQNICVRR